MQLSNMCLIISIYYLTPPLEHARLQAYEKSVRAYQRTDRFKISLNDRIKLTVCAAYYRHTSFSYCGIKDRVYPESLNERNIIVLHACLLRSEWK